MFVVGGIACIYFCGSVLRQQGSERLVEEGGIWRSFASATGAFEEMFIDRGADGSRPAEWCHLDRSILNAMTIMP